MRITTVLTGSFLLLAGVVGIVGGVGIYTAALVSSEFETITDRESPKLFTLARVTAEYRRMMLEGFSLRMIAGFASTPEPDEAVTTLRNNADQPEDFNASPKISALPHIEEAHQAELAEFEEAYNSALNLVSTYDALVSSSAEHEVAQNLHRQIDLLHNTIYANLDITSRVNGSSFKVAWSELEDFEEAFDHNVIAETDRLLAQLTAQNQQTKTFVWITDQINLVGTLAAVVIALLLGYFISRNIAKPIQVIETGAQKLGHGQLSTRIQVNGLHEVQSLADTFNRMAEQLLAQQATQEITRQELQATNTQLQAANKQALAAAQAKCDFLANVSHEIRTPMTAILGYTETLFEPEVEVSEHKNAIRTIQRNGEFLLQIINDILDLSKIEAGMFEIDQRRFSLIQIIAEVESLMRIRARVKNLPFDVEYLSAVPETISTDPMRLRQILINLLSNAIKFTEHGGVKLQIRLLDDATSPCLSFRVIDTGIGIGSEELGKLFKPFTQADTSTTREFGGTGLGLSISKRLVELMGGGITVESESGVGSVFEVRLPTGSLEDVPLLDNPMDTVHPSSESLNGMEIAPDQLHLRILLAEDGPDNQRLISRVLVRAGAEVDIVDNGQDAIEAALSARDRGQAYDVILMDMQMPTIDGYEATQTLRDHGYGGPIVALTAHAMSSDRQKCLKAGCDEYATKPIKRKVLIELLQRLWRQPAVKSED